MGIRSKLLFRHAMIGAAALVAASTWLGAPPARAQSHSSAALPPGEIERMIGARGYRLTGPVVRHGKVYIASVLGQQDDVEQLVVDARDGYVATVFPAARLFAAKAATRRMVSAGEFLRRPVWRSGGRALLSAARVRFL